MSEMAIVLFSLDFMFRNESTIEFRPSATLLSGQLAVKHCGHVAEGLRDVVSLAVLRKLMKKV